jgi:uncharacterized lipoprotein YmbA
MNVLRVITGVCLLLGLSGCASPAPHYYTLITPAENAPSAIPPAAFVLRVQPVTVPEQLNQPQLVIRKSDGEIVISDSALWAAPLPEEIRSALSAQLERSLNTTDIRALTPPPDKPVITLRVTVQQLDAWPQRHASLTARWQLRFGADAKMLTCRSQHQIDVTGGVPELITAQQKLIAALAADVSDAIKSRHCR